jgi:hypothetical protein
LYALSPRPAAICRVSAVPVDVAPSMQKLADARTRWEADRNHVPNPIVCYTTRSRTCGRNRRLERSANTHRRARRLRAMLAVPCSTDLTAFVFVRGGAHGMFLGGRGNGDGLWMVCSSMINPSGRPSCASPYLSTSIMCSRSRLHENERPDRTKGRPICNMRTRSRTHRRERRGARRNRS